MQEFMLIKKINGIAIGAMLVFSMLLCACATKRISPGRVKLSDSAFCQLVQDIFADRVNNYDSILKRDYLAYNMHTPIKSHKTLFVRLGVFSKKEQMENCVKLIKQCFPQYRFFEVGYLGRYKGSEDGKPFLGNGYGGVDMLILVEKRDYYRVGLKIKPFDSSERTWLIPEQAYTPTLFDTTLAKVIDVVKKGFPGIRGELQQWKDVNRLCIDGAQTSQVLVRKKRSNSYYQACFYADSSQLQSDLVYDSLVARCKRHFGAGYQFEDKSRNSYRAILITGVSDIKYDDKKGVRAEIDRVEQNDGRYFVRLGIWFY